MKYNAVIVAAGSGTRMGLGYNKVYLTLKDGRTVLDTTVSVFEADPDCTQIIIVTDSREYLSRNSERMHGRITLAAGGATRQESVSNGLKAVITDYVMIHDGARPYLDQASLRRLKEVLETADAALLCVACKDTVKYVKDGVVGGTYPRETLIAAQTPQAFRTELILECMEKAAREGWTGTDDCSLAERYSDVRIIPVEGSYANIKITTPEDIPG